MYIENFNLEAGPVNNALQISCWAVCLSNIRQVQLELALVLFRSQSVCLS